MADHCTLFWDIWKDYDISGCCELHDELYENQLVTRKYADLALRDCVNKTTNSSLGDLMYAGVRAFGWFFWLWHKIKQKIGSNKKLNILEKSYGRVIKTIFRAILNDEKFKTENRRYTKY